MHLDPGPLVVVLVLAAAVLHATWNAMAHAAEDRLVGFALMSLATGVIGLALVVTSDGLGRADLAYAAVSALLHVAYMVLLWISYQGGDLSRAYPLSRGTGVALVAATSFFVPRSPLGPDIVLGAGLVVLGLVGVTLAGPRLTRADAPGIGAALATGCAIAGYTVVDGLAVSGGAPVLAYAGWLFVLQSWAMPVLAVLRRGRALPALARRQAVVGLAGGAVSLAAYGLVLLAQTSGALAAVAALRELSIGLGVLIGVFLLHEPAARKRLLPALVLTAGAVLLALSIG
jgi:drug/metabolite transporter (DMT)-like permease